MTTFSIQNRYLLGLGNWLSTLSLSGKESRERTRFIMLLQEQLVKNEAVRMQFLEEMGTKGEDGKLLLVQGENGQNHYDVLEDKMPEFNKALEEMQEELFMCGGDGLKNRLKVMKDVVLNTTVEITPQVAAEYDKWCEAFESMTEEE